MTALLFALTACSALDTDCEELSTPLTGDLETDLVGTWDGYGTDSRILYVFEEGGDWRRVEPPNAYAPSGLEASGTWEIIEGNELELTQDGSSWSLWVYVGERTLETWYSNPDATDSGQPWASEWTRSECSGYGF